MDTVIFSFHILNIFLTYSVTYYWQVIEHESAYTLNKILDGSRHKI